MITSYHAVAGLASSGFHFIQQNSAEKPIQLEV